MNIKQYFYISLILTGVLYVATEMRNFANWTRRITQSPTIVHIENQGDLEMLSSRYRNALTSTESAKAESAAETIPPVAQNTESQLLPSEVPASEVLPVAPSETVAIQEAAPREPVKTSWAMATLFFWMPAMKPLEPLKPQPISEGNRTPANE